MTDVTADTAPASQRADIELTVPADSTYLSVIRTAAAALAARLDFTLDDIEDLRIAVDEACSILLSQAAADGRLHCSFQMQEDGVTVQVSVRSEEPQVPSQRGFAWTVLTELTSDVKCDVVDGDQLRIELSQRRHTPGGA